MAKRKDEALYVLKSNRNTYMNNRSGLWGPLGTGSVMRETDIKMHIAWLKQWIKAKKGSSDYDYYRLEQKQVWEGISWKKIKLVYEAD